VSIVVGTKALEVIRSSNSSLLNFVLMCSLVTTVTPRDNWGGKGLLGTKASLLFCFEHDLIRFITLFETTIIGLSIRFCQLKGAGEFVWHILVSRWKLEGDRALIGKKRC